VNGRLHSIEKFGPPKDMDMTFHTLAHVAPKMDVDELNLVRYQLGLLLGKEFLIKSDQDRSCIHKTINEKIDIFVPEEGQVIKRLVELAKERNIQYTPSAEARQQLTDYCLRKEIANPLEGGKAANIIPQYNPPMP